MTFTTVYRKLLAMVILKLTTMNTQNVVVAFWATCLVKVSNIHFLVEIYILFKKKDVFKFFLAVLMSQW